MNIGHKGKILWSELLVVGVLSGCSHLDPMTLSIDTPSVNSGWIRPVEKESRIIVASKIGLYAEDGSDRAVLNTKRVRERVQALTEKELMVIPGVSVVNLDSVNDIEKVQVVNGQLIGLGEVPNIDYVLTADSVMGYYSNPGTAVNVARKARGVMVETLFTLSDVSAKLPLFSESFSNEAFSETIGELKGCIDDVVKSNAKMLKKYYLRRYVAVNMEVKECRGGRFALIDFPVSARECVCVGDAVSIYEKRKVGDKWSDIEVATGKVYSFAPGSSLWIDVDDYQNVGVMRGHYAKLMN